MLSFRRKILLSDIALFLVFMTLLFPFVERTVGKIMRQSLENRASQLIHKLEIAPDFSSMIEMMETETEFIFQRVSLIDAEGVLLYDSHVPKLQQKGVSLAYDGNHPEIQEAMQHGLGYSESYSELFQETFAYVAQVFESHGQPYILRTGFPFREVRELTTDFEMGFLLLGSLILLLYSIMTWAIIHRLSQPIQQIVNAISPYQEGKEEHLTPIVLNSSLKEDEFGKLAFTLNSLSDRIQRQIQNLTQQRKQTEGILESLGEGVIALDTRAKVIFANQVACRFLHISHEALIGKSLREGDSLQEELLKKGHELVLQALQTLEPAFQMGTYGNAGRVYLHLIAAPLANQNGAILVIQDKTSDYRIVEMGKDFIANASHELRTPITIIRGFAETLQDLPDLSKEMLQDITEKIVRTCGRLDKLVKSLLTLADIENLSEQNFRTIDLVLLAENCKHLLLTAHRKVDIQFVSELYHAPVLADGDLLDLAIMNLLENAVKYSQEPARITMKIQRVGAQVQLTVKDEGIGIPELDLPHIFNRFYTVDKARSRKSGGAGLGLSIVKTIVEKHNGTVTVLSELGKGTEFHLNLNLKNAVESVC